VKIVKLYCHQQESVKKSVSYLKYIKLSERRSILHNRQPSTR